MAKERIVRGVFSDGSAIERGSVGKVYTHAWKVTGTRTEAARAVLAKSWGSEVSPTATESGFSSSGEIANRAMQSVKNNWLRGTSFTSVSGEVVAVVEIAKRGAPA